MLPSSKSMVLVFVGWVSVHLNLTWGFSRQTPDSSLIKNRWVTQRGTSLLFIEYYVVPAPNKVATTKNCNVKMEKNKISKSWTHDQCNYCCFAYCSTVWAMNSSGSWSNISSNLFPVNEVRVFKFRISPVHWGSSSSTGRPMKVIFYWKRKRIACKQNCCVLSRRLQS